MIRLTRLNNVPLYLNSDLIEHIDATPDTVISLTSGQKFLVTESPEEVCEKVLAFRKSILERDLGPGNRTTADRAPREASHGR
jgi:flagellar protein FlbD